MARIRTVKPEFWEDERCGRLSTLARLNFLGLISLADDEGRGRAAPEYLLRRLHPYASDVKMKRFRRSLDELEATGMVQFYQANGERLYLVVHFSRHQRINRPTPSRLPPPPSLIEASRSRQGARVESSPPERNGEERSGTEVERSGANQEENAEPPPLRAPPVGSEPDQKRAPGYRTPNLRAIAGLKPRPEDELAKETASDSRIERYSESQMPRGGRRPGADRPKGSRDGVPRRNRVFPPPDPEVKEK